MLDFNRIWLPFLYLYGVGGLIFIIGMYIISKSQSIKVERVRHKKWFYILLFGFIYYVSIHSFFILLAINQIIPAILIFLIISLLRLKLLFFVFKKPKNYS